MWRWKQLLASCWWRGSTACLVFSPVQLWFFYMNTDECWIHSWLWVRDSADKGRAQKFTNRWNKWQVQSRVAFKYPYKCVHGFQGNSKFWDPGVKRCYYLDKDHWWHPRWPKWTFLWWRQDSVIFPIHGASICQARDWVINWETTLVSCFGKQIHQVCGQELLWPRSRTIVFPSSIQGTWR